MYYTHRQKLSNSKLVFNIKNCFVPKYLISITHIFPSATSKTVSPKKCGVA